MVHVGIAYEKFLDGYRLHQQVYALALKTIPLTKERARQEDQPCVASEKHELHVGVGGLLFLCYTRMDLVNSTLLLQSAVHAPFIRDIKFFNTVIGKAHARADSGLVYRRLQQPTCVAAIRDASGSAKRTSYAIEGRLVCRKDDRLVWEAEGSFAGHLWNGRAHVLTHAGKKSKRVSQSTSHGEALFTLRRFS